MSVVARPQHQEAPVARVAGWTSRTSQDPRFCDLSDRCTLDVHQSLTVRVVCVSLLIYIRTNTHAHTRTRGPAVGLEPRADNNDPAYPQTQIPSSGPHVRSWPPPPLSGGERERTHLYVPTAIRWGSMGRHALKWSNVCGRLTRMGATHAAAKSDRLIRTVLLSAKM